MSEYKRLVDHTRQAEVLKLSEGDGKRSIIATESLAMNVLRTIQKSEPDKDWLDSLVTGNYPLKRKRHPYSPPVFPLPFEPQQNLIGGFLYLVFDGKISAYGNIVNVCQHSGETVGSQAQYVKPGYNILLSGKMSLMPFQLMKRGFTGIRYVQQNLHQLSQAKAQAIVNRLR